jgi:hypothetical protein
LINQLPFQELDLEQNHSETDKVVRANVSYGFNTLPIAKFFPGTSLVSFLFEDAYFFSFGRSYHLFKKQFT